MTFLVIDTSGNHAVVALGESDGYVRDTAVFEGRRTLSQKLMGMIDQLLSKNGLSISALSCLAVGRGPGSFTGLRVGMTTVKTLAQVTGRPIVGVNTLDAYAYGVPGDFTVALTPSRRGEVYACVFHQPQASDILSGSLPFREGLGVGSGSFPFTEGLGLGSDGEITFGTPFAASSERVADICGRLKDAGTITVCGEPQCMREIAGQYDRVERESVPAESLVALAVARIREGRFDDFMTLLPLYVVPPAISSPRDASILPSAPLVDGTAPPV